MSTSASSYVCDTIPAARLATDNPSPIPPDDHLDEPVLRDVSPQPVETKHRKLCVRHQRMADEGTNLKLQQVRPSLPYAAKALLTMFAVPGRHASRRTGICQRHLVQFLLFLPPPTSSHFTRLAHNVLLLSTLPADRAAGPDDSHRPISISTPGSLHQDPRLPRCHVPLSRCSSQPQVEGPR